MGFVRPGLTCYRIDVDDGPHGIGTQELVGEISHEFSTKNNRGMLWEVRLRGGETVYIESKV
jgi:hypothetical protein